MNAVQALISHLSIILWFDFMCHITVHAIQSPRSLHIKWDIPCNHFIFYTLPEIIGRFTAIKQKFEIGKRGRNLVIVINLLVSNSLGRANVIHFRSLLDGTGITFGHFFSFCHVDISIDFSIVAKLF